MQSLQTTPVHPALRPFIEAIWYFAGDFSHARERILPTGRMQLLVNLHEDELRTYDGAGFTTLNRIRGSAISGAYTRAFGIDTAEQRRIVGVVFAPGGAAPFFAESQDAFQNQHVELERVWGDAGASLRDRLLESASPAVALTTVESVLLERIVRPLEVDKLVEFAVAALDRGAGIAQVAARVGMSSRTFLRQFERRVGVSPRRFARIRRFGRALESVERGQTVEWSRVAAACGYFDQAHMIHDFREFAGMPPTHYQPRAERDPYHAVLDD
jgi:AraC-like DNA-binding protein